MHDDNSIVAVLTNGLDKLLAVLPEGKIFSVALVIINGDKTFTGVGIDKDKCDT